MNGIGSSEINNKRNDIINFPFLDGEVPHSPSYGIYIFLSLFVL